MNAWFEYAVELELASALRHHKQHEMSQMMLINDSTVI